MNKLYKHYVILSLTTKREITKHSRLAATQCLNKLIVSGLAGTYKMFGVDSADERHLIKAYSVSNAMSKGQLKNEIEVATNV